MKAFSTLIFLLISPLFSVAQKATKNIYAELGGPGGFISANSDTRFAKSTKGLGIRAGAGTIFDFYTAGITLPVGLNYLIGNDKHFLELGAGVSYIYLPLVHQDQPFNFKKESSLIEYAWIGYRYQPLQKGFTFRAGFSSIFNDLNIPVLTIRNAVTVYAGFSFGYSFQ